MHLYIDKCINNCRLGVDFVSRRGIMGRLLRAAYIPARVEVFVTLYRGTYYLLKGEAFDPDGVRETELQCQQDPRSNYVGPKFKQLVTSGKSRII